jgi:hypothetical protein
VEESRYFVSLDKLKELNRAFSQIAQNKLCPLCKDKYASEIEEMSLEDFFEIIKNCCSKQEDFFDSKLPLVDMIFRLFLANGNEPLSLEEIEEKLREVVGSSRNVSTWALKRIIEADKYYGIDKIAVIEDNSSSLSEEEDNGEERIKEETF